MGILVHSLKMFNWVYEMSGPGGAAVVLRWADCLHNPSSLERHKGPTRTVLSANKTGTVDGCEVYSWREDPQVQLVSRVYGATAQ